MKKKMFEIKFEYITSLLNRTRKMNNRLKKDTYINEFNEFFIIIYFSGYYFVYHFPIEFIICDPSIFHEYFHYCSTYMNFFFFLVFGTNEKNQVLVQSYLKNQNH